MRERLVTGVVDGLLSAAGSARRGALDLRLMARTALPGAPAALAGDCTPASPLAAPLATPVSPSTPPLCGAAAALDSASAPRGDRRRGDSRATAGDVNSVTMGASSGAVSITGDRNGERSGGETLPVPARDGWSPAGGETAAGLSTNVGWRSDDGGGGGDSLSGDVDCIVWM
jgi:hypothetical protein